MNFNYTQQTVEPITSLDCVINKILLESEERALWNQIYEDAEVVSCGVATPNMIDNLDYLELLREIAYANGDGDEAKRLSNIDSELTSFSKERV